MSKHVSILILDKKSLFSKGINAILKHFPDFNIIEGTDLCGEDLQIIQTAQPDIIMIGKPGFAQNEIHALKTVKGMYPDSRIIAFIETDCPVEVKSVINAGASAYLAKDRLTVEDLVGTINKIRNHRNGQLPAMHN